MVMILVVVDDEDNMKYKHVSNDKKHCCLGYIGDYTTQLCGDYDKPL